MSVDRIASPGIVQAAHRKVQGRCAYSVFSRMSIVSRESDGPTRSFLIARILPTSGSYADVKPGLYR